MAHVSFMLSLGAALCCTATGGQTLRMDKVAEPHGLVPLNLSVGGRVRPDRSNSTPAFPATYQSQWPGVYFKTAFAGSELYLRIGTNHEILHIVSDDQKPLVLVNPEPGIYRLSGLASTPHEVSVFTATESQQAPNVFGGFAIPRSQLALPIRKQPRQIEFIGDSHTVGYGNTSLTQECTDQQVWATTDNTQAFGALTARHYHADYQVNAISGRGIVRNYNGSLHDTLPEAYPYVLFDKQDKVNDPSWNPQVIVIALGTNDFSTPLNPGEKWKTRQELHADYEATYVRFLQALHATHPHASFILWANEISNGEMEAEVQKVFQQAKALGITKLSYIPVDHLTFNGCHSHPSLADHRTISTRLQHVIDSTPDIWQGK